MSEVLWALSSSGIKSCLSVEVSFLLQYFYRGEDSPPIDPTTKKQLGRPCNLELFKWRQFRNSSKTLPLDKLSGALCHKSVLVIRLGMVDF